VGSSPAQRSAFDQLADLFSKLQVAAGGPNPLREHLETAGKKPTDQEVDELWTAATDFDSYSVKADQNAQIATALQLATSIAPVLAEMPWALQKFERRRLLTSNRPIGFNRFPQNSDPFMGVGFGTADVIWFPLTRSAALLVSPHVTGVALLPLTVRAAREINQLIVFYADRWLYYHPDDELMDGLEIKRPERASS
jgi:hypothetical protein